MAYLLGGKACMDSLRNDVQDVHWSVSDIVSRTGLLEFPSWKFPDKMSCDLDMDDLMEMYDYSDGEEENQVAHIALYELVIDRLVYLVQAMTKYTEQLMSVIKPGGENSTGTSSSVGLVVKKYCGRLIHLHTLIQHIQSENKTKTRKITDLEKNIQKLNSEVHQNGYLSPKQNNLSNSNMDDSSSSNLSASSPNMDISRDACNKSSQTIETAFVACESCDVVQKNLRETGDIVIHVCTTQGLPSSLKKFRPQVAGYDWLSANDIMRWTHEQNKDLSRINKYMDQIVTEVKPLKAEVTAFEKETKQMEHKVRKIENELKLEKDTQIAIKRQYEIKLQEKESTFTEKMASVNRQKDEITRARKDLERELEKSRVELRQQQSELETLETTQKDLEKELRKTKVDQEEINRLEDKVKLMKTELNQVTDKLESQTKDYNLELSKNKMAQKRNDNLQAKQASLLERVNELDRENEELKDQMNELEEEKEKITEKLEQLEDEKTQLQQQVDENKAEHDRLAKEKDDLEKTMEETRHIIQQMEKQVNEAKEREKLLVEYPDLNGPVNPDYKGTGNLVKDMENQVKANLIRIQILENQSEGLQNSICKFVSNQGHSPVRSCSKSSSQSSVPSNTTMMGGPKQLWKVDEMDNIQEEDNNTSYRLSNQNNSNSNDISPRKSKPRVKPNIFTMNFDTSSTKTKDEFVVTKTTRPESGKRVKERPLSSKGSVMTPVNKTSIGAYLQMKKGGHLGSAGTGRPPSGKVSNSSNHGNKTDNSDYSPTMFVCNQCDKMYDRERDLEIHRSYCTP
ncbi:hypothetical protein SNE40_004149 [Patella caerulea]|uniref:Uncharacterized protein n=1 Tax=Patella caerulea TaxID=87958 RepID=A0AAN8Q6A5_PATCE